MLRAISVEVLDELTSATGEFDDNMHDLAYRRSDLIPALKEDWVSKIHVVYKEWIGKIAEATDRTRPGGAAEAKKLPPPAPAPLKVPEAKKSA